MLTFWDKVKIGFDIYANAKIRNWGIFTMDQAVLEELENVEMPVTIETRSLHWLQSP